MLNLQIKTLELILWLQKFVVFCYRVAWDSLLSPRPRYTVFSLNQDEIRLQNELFSLRERAPETNIVENNEIDTIHFKYYLGQC